MDDLHDFLLKKLTGEVDSANSIALKFKENKITGSVFLDLTLDDLREILPLVGEIKIIKSVVDSFAITVVSIMKGKGIV